MSATVYIFCSGEPESGKTLLARICRDLLTHADPVMPRVFDTDHPAGRLAQWYEEGSQVIDFTRMRDQVRLFDTMITEPRTSYVINLQPEHLERFFTIYRDIGFEEGAREAGLGVAVFFMAGVSAQARRKASWLGDMLGSAPLTVVRNEAILGPQAATASASQNDGVEASRVVVLPRLSPAACDWIGRPGFHFGRFFSGSQLKPPSEIRLELSFFMEKLEAWSRRPGWHANTVL